MEIFIYIVFLLIMEVQCYNAPTVYVSPDVISEISSVKISCETPAYVTVNQCYFTINREENNVKVSPSCELQFSGAQLLSLAGVKSPQSIDINCYYTKNERGIYAPSSHSPAATVTVLDTLQKPFISVNEDDDLPKISCEIPLSVRADFTCSFYTENGAFLYRVLSQRSQNGEKHICMFYPSHSNLSTQLVNSRQISCDYTPVTTTNIVSQRSNTVTIRGLLQARLSASASVLHETDTVELSCKNNEELKMENCVFNINGRESNSKLSSSCQLSLTASQISVWSEDQSSSVRITCFYTVMQRHISVPSPHSDPVTVTFQTSTPTPTAYTTTTAMKTSTLTVMSTSTTTTNTEAVSTMSKCPKASQTDTKSSTSAAISTTETSMTLRTDVSSVQTSTAHKDQPVSRYKVIWLIVLVCTGVGVILSGFLGIICVCWFARKRRRERNNLKSTKPDVSSQGIGVSGCEPPELYSLITSAPDTSKPVFEDSRQHNTADPADTFMTVNTMYQSSDVSVNKKTQGKAEESENVYHLYSTIPDKPVQSSAGDEEYNFIQKHR